MKMMCLYFTVHSNKVFHYDLENQATKSVVDNIVNIKQVWYIAAGNTNFKSVSNSN